MKVIRANRGLYVPNNPEKPDNNSMRLVPTGLVALVPEDFNLPEGSYADLGKFKEKKKKEDQESEEV